MITIELYGRTCVHVDGQEVPRSRLPGKQMHILEILALSAGTPVAKERLADRLWDGAPPDSWLGTLESYVCLLRRTLGLGPGRSSLLATSPAGYVLEVGPALHVDTHRFEVLVHEAATATGSRLLGVAEEALSIARGQLLADVPYADWAVRARAEHSRRLADLCARAAQNANGIGELDRAAVLAQAAVDLDGSHEFGWRQLMLAHWFAGRRSQALATYGRMREELVAQLGEEPGGESHELYLAILRDTADSARPGTGDDRTELATLLQLLRQALDHTPGFRAPARDAQLSAVATRALAAAC